MPLITACPNCFKNFKVPYTAETRSRLQMKHGDDLRVNCPHCATIATRHVNEVYRSSNPVLIIIGLVLGVALTALLWNWYGRFTLISLGIPFILWQDQERRVKAFNGYTIRRK